MWNTCGAENCERQARSPNSKFCNLHYSYLRLHGDINGSPEVKRRACHERNRFCVVDGCVCEVRSTYAEYCEKHYARLRRFGTLELTNTYTGITLASNGYVMELAHGHPLSDASGRVYQHRLVYHRHNGNGPFKCYHCEKSVTWKDMHIDHLDCNKTNNSIENIVASCARCNMARGVEKMKKTRRARGTQITAFGETRNINEWAEDLGITTQSIRWRLDRGWSPERAVSEPRGVTGPKAQHKH